MAQTFDVLISPELPPETDGTSDDFVRAVRDCVTDIDILASTNYGEFTDHISAAEIVVEHNLASDLINHATELEWIHTLSSGADFYDLERVEKIGAILTTVSGVHANPIGEYVCSAMLYFEKGIYHWREQQRDREWRRFPAGELGERTLGVVGVGEIGGRVAELGEAFGMDVLGLRRHPSRSHRAVDEMYGPEDRHELLGQADYVVATCPLTEETRGLIGRPELHSMDNDAVLINVSRGEVVEQDALVEHLQTGYLGGAALDVAETEPLPQDSPLWSMSDVLLTPHMAGGSPKFAERCAEIFAKNYKFFVEDQPEKMENRVV